MHNNLTSSHINTPLGKMIAVSDDNKLYFLQFDDHQSLEAELKKFEVQSKIIVGETKTSSSIKKELDEYFASKLVAFKTPLSPFGTPFQKKTWQALTQIAFGSTNSYAQLATSIEKPTAYRAVAQANGANPIVIVIPCHRIINSNGKLGGYSAGIERKEWLLNHESNC